MISEDLKSMEDIQDVHFVELENSKYLKPIRMKYTQASRSEFYVDTLTQYELHKKIGL